tara:strand:- start:731 stop:1240 length:510 start_codon:yes stop_codon:yes gene_type:complete
MNPKAKATFEIVGTLILVIGAIFLTRYEDIKGGFFLDSINFETTQGKIITSNVNYHIGVNSAPGYRFRVEYEFEAEREKYTSDSVSFGSKILKDKHRAEEIIKKYPVGKEVTVYYEKNNPDFSTLEPTKNSNDDLILTFAIFVFLIFSVIAILYFRLKTNSNKNKSGAH